MFHPNGKQKRRVVVILTSDKVGFKKNCTKRRSLFDDRSIQEDIVNIYVFKIGTLK